MAHPLRAATAETLAGTRTLTLAEVAEYGIWELDPGGAGRTVNLPAIADSTGQLLLIKNTADAAEVLTIADSVGTVSTPTQNESAILWCGTTRWASIAGANS